MNECQGTEPREVVIALADGQCNVGGGCVCVHLGIIISCHLPPN
jgi:hypothetical protein